MSDIAITVEKLGKRYRIGERERYYTLRDTLAKSLVAPYRWIRNGGQSTTGSGTFPPILNSQFAIRHSQSETIWALKDVSFEIKRGEVVGVIGRNGAGKSTLLKILSRITEPTEGEARIYGRVGSLLEVGTGFHYELTGRENIYLNGAILGMKKAEIDRRFDEIVAFAEVETFLDTPVKHYSSGMYLRLAFSVAAHLEPEILIVDEVLAVGDAAFQKKCLGKMEDVAKEGRTVLFVSHNMEAVQRLCSTAMWISEGRLFQNGPTSLVTTQYLEHTIQDYRTHFEIRTLKSDPEKAHYEFVKLMDSDGRATGVFASGTSLIIEARIKMEFGSLSAQCGIDLMSQSGVCVANVNSRILGYDPLKITDGTILRWHIAELRLTPGRYLINLRLKASEKGELIDFVEGAAAFEVVGSDIYHTGYPISSGQGITYLPVSLYVS